MIFVFLHSSSYQSSNIERFSRKCGQHTALAKHAKSSLSVDVRHSKLTSLLNYENVEYFLPGSPSSSKYFHAERCVSNSPSHFISQMYVTSAWVYNWYPVNARLHSPSFSSPSNTCHAIYSVISITTVLHFCPPQLHLIYTSHLHITRKMLSEFSAMHVLLKGH